MTEHDGIDAAFPGFDMPPGRTILAAYVGEPGEAEPPDTPHIWSRDEWNEYLMRVPGLRALPIYTHNFPGDPRECAANAANAVRALGWRAGVGRLIVADLEQLIDPAYQHGLAAAIETEGFEMLPYQPLWAAQQAGWAGKVWAPILTLRRPRVLTGQLAGIQWRWHNAYDDNVFSQWVYDRAGKGPRP